MDPRRTYELNLAAEKGAARREASEATQRSVQAAIQRNKERRQSQDIEMLDPSPLRSSTLRPSASLERLSAENRSQSLNSTASLDRSLSSDSAFGLSTSPSSMQHSMPRQPVRLINTQISDRQRSNGSVETSNSGLNSGQRIPPTLRTMPATAPQIIDLDCDSPLPLRQRIQQPASRPFQQQPSTGFVDLTGESPPHSQVAPRRQVNRVDLDSIGSHSLRRGPSNLNDHQAQRPPAERQASRNISQLASRDHWDNAVDLAQSTSAEYPSAFAVPDAHNRQQSSRAVANGSSTLQHNNHRYRGHVQRGRSTRRSEANVGNFATGTDQLQEDQDLALAMSLAAEDDGTAWPTNPRCSLQALRGRGLRQSTLRMGPRFRSYAGPSMIDPFSVLHPTMLLGHQAGQNSPDLDAAYAMMASLVSDLDGPNSMSHPGAYSGGDAQDMSYEALTNLEDVKLTAPPELLATMPLDMCLKGSPWEEKVCSICQSEYELDEVIMILPCEHHFHRDCAMEWLSKHSKKCPICKESIGG